jgi:hypothetical protein
VFFRRTLNLWRVRVRHPACSNSIRIRHVRILRTSSSHPSLHPSLHPPPTLPAGKKDDRPRPQQRASSCPLSNANPLLPPREASFEPAKSVALSFFFFLFLFVFFADVDLLQAPQPRHGPSRARNTTQRPGQPRACTRSSPPLLVSRFLIFLYILFANLVILQARAATTSPSHECRRPTCQRQLPDRFAAPAAAALVDR